MTPILLKSLQDIFSKEVLSFIVKISLISMLLSAFIVLPLYGLISMLITFIFSLISWEWLHSINPQNISYFIAYVIFTIFVSLFTSLYSEKLLVKIANKSYPNSPVVGSPKTSISLLISIKASMVFMLLFLVLLPLVFVPFLGQIVMLYLWSILLKEPTIYDVGKLFINDKSLLKAKRKKSRRLAMIASLLNTIPLVNLFAPIFGQILFLHHILRDNSQN